MTEATAPEVSGEDTAAVLNHAAEGQKTYLGEPKEVEAPQDEATGDDAAAETDDKEKDEAPPVPSKKSVQDRIDELTRDKHAERRAREAAEKRIAELEARVNPHPTADTKAEDAEPDPADFQYGEADPAYIRAITAHTTRKVIREETERTQRETQARTVAQSWDQRQAEFAKEHPDYFETLDREWVCTRPMADAIATSEDGARVAYHLAQNPDEARRIAALPPIAQVRELGRLETKLAPAPVPSTPEPKTVSDAPPPAPQARGLRGQFKPPADTDDFAAFERAFFPGG